MSIKEQETDIIKGCRLNDRKAQEQLYRNYYKVMMQLSLRYTKNDDALEVLNNAFLKIFLNIKKYEAGKASLYTWIRIIVINTCIDFVKKNISSIEHKKINAETVFTANPEVISKMNISALLHCMRQLPTATQTVFNLHVMEGYSHREIAEMLAVSEGTSKWHVSEARKELQQMILSEEVKI